MSKKKEGIREKIANFIKPKDSEFFEKFGRSIYVTGAEAKAQQTIQELFEELRDPLDYKKMPSQQLLELHRRINVASEKLHYNLLPMLTAKDNKEFAKLIALFDEITQDKAADVLDVALYLAKREPKEDKKKTREKQGAKTNQEAELAEARVIAEEWHQYILRDYLPKVKFLTALWGERDKQPLSLYDIQTMVPFPAGGYGETIPSSGGRTSEDHMRHPEGGPYKRKIKNEP